jgi:LPS-assembly protein
LEGFSERNSFELRAYSFQRQLGGFDQNILPNFIPALDYSYHFANSPLGGQLKAGISAYSLERGDYADASRLTAALDWRREIITSAGLVFEPMAGVRADFYHSDGGNYALGASGSNSATYTEKDRAELLPYAGLTARYPLIASNGLGVHVVEPVVQIISRPDVDDTNIVNEDAQSLIFDTSNLFEIDKFSGKDRREGGTRLNAGGRYTLNMAHGGTLTAAFGQSFHLAGDNPFPTDSGLDQDRSDYVGSVFYLHNRNINGFARVRLDKDNFDANAVETNVTMRNNRLSLTGQYAYYDSQTALGLTQVRHQAAAQTSIKLDDNWRLFGGIRYDLEDNITLNRNIGLGYSNECFIFDLAYTESFDRNGERSGGINFNISIRTLLETAGNVNNESVFD